MKDINGYFTHYDSVGFGFHRKRDIDALLGAQEGKCFFCASKLEDADGCIKFEIDHLQPLSNWGSNWPDNLALTCPPCNSKKHWRTERQYWNLLKKEHGDNWVTKRRSRTKKLKKIKAQLTKANSAERYAALEELLENLREKLRHQRRNDAPEFDLILEERRMMIDLDYARDYRMDPIVCLRLGNTYILTDITFGGRVSISRWYNRNGKRLVNRLKQIPS